MPAQFILLLFLNFAGMLLVQELVRPAAPKRVGVFCLFRGCNYSARRSPSTLKGRRALEVKCGLSPRATAWWKEIGWEGEAHGFSLGCTGARERWKRDQPSQETAVRPTARERLYSRTPWQPFSRHIGVPRAGHGCAVGTWGWVIFSRADGGCEPPTGSPLCLVKKLTVSLGNVSALSVWHEMRRLRNSCSKGWVMH